jgi:hypothetical protein
MTTPTTTRNPVPSNSEEEAVYKKNHLNPPRIRDDTRSFLGPTLLGGNKEEDDKLLEEYRKNADRGTHYSSTPIENEQQHFKDQQREYDGIIAGGGYSYSSSDDLIPGVIVGEKKRISKTKTPRARAKTFQDLSETPSFSELAQVSAELKAAKDKKMIVKERQQQHPSQTVPPSPPSGQSPQLQDQQPCNSNKKKTRKQLEEEEEEEAEINRILSI